MKCKNCGVKISDLEIYCDECKEILKQERENEEFNKLALENKKLNELENTIEIDTLDSLEEKIEETKEEVEEKKEEVTEDTKEIIEKQEEIIEKTNNKKKIVIITLISLFFAIGLILVLLFVFNNEEKEEIEIDYKKVITEYGDAVKLEVDKYINESNEIPSWNKISKLVKHKKYKVSCKTNKIYEDGSVYLNNCTVDGTKIKYSYGKKQEEKKEGKKISIFKTSNGEYIGSESNGTLVATITCETLECEYVDAFDKYVLVKEKDKYYLYDYENNILEYGPFNINLNENNLLTYNNKLYGVVYIEENTTNIYSLASNKELKNIKGFLLTSEEGFSPSIMYKYGYVIFDNNGISNFINLNTGNISYSINGILNSFIEDIKNNIVYITTYNSQNKKITIYNSNGKKLFNGKEFNNIKLVDGNLIVSDDTKYYVYDSNLKLKLTSKTYDNILGLYDDFVVIVDNNNLEIVNLNDQILATFDLKWDNLKYKFHASLSGRQTVNNKNGIYLVIEDKSISNGTSGKVLKYYYIPNTKEIGVIKLNKIN